MTPQKWFTTLLVVATSRLKTTVVERTEGYGDGALFWKNRRIWRRRPILKEQKVMETAPYFDIYLSLVSLPLIRGTLNAGNLFDFIVCNELEQKVLTVVTLDETMHLDLRCFRCTFIRFYEKKAERISWLIRNTDEMQYKKSFHSATLVISVKHYSS